MYNEQEYLRTELIEHKFKILEDVISTINLRESALNAQSEIKSPTSSRPTTAVMKSNINFQDFSNDVLSVGSKVNFEQNTKGFDKGSKPLQNLDLSHQKRGSDS